MGLSGILGLDVNIATKEMIPIVIVAAIWGRVWMGQVVCCCCDNEAVVARKKKRRRFDASFTLLNLP